jgi:3-methyladenine DNA glycosylase AlkD
MRVSALQCGGPEGMIIEIPAAVLDREGGTQKMTIVATIMSELKKKGKEQTRKIYAQHGMNPERVYGVSVADLKVIAKTIKGRQDLARELYETGK